MVINNSNFLLGLKKENYLIQVVCLLERNTTLTKMERFFKS